MPPARSAVSRPDLLGSARRAPRQRTGASCIDLGGTARRRGLKLAIGLQGRAQPDDLLHAVRQSRAALRDRSGASRSPIGDGARSACADARPARLLPPGVARLEQHRAARRDGGARRSRLLPGGLLLCDLCRGRPAPAAALPRFARTQGPARLDDRRHRAWHLGALPRPGSSARLCALLSPSPNAAPSPPHHGQPARIEAWRMRRSMPLRRLLSRHARDDGVLLDPAALSTAISISRRRPAI